LLEFGRCIWFRAAFLSGPSEGEKRLGIVVGERVRALAETLQDFVAAPLAHGLRDQKNLILRQRFASRFPHPHTFEHDRFKSK
jgi:hypothetical protein